MFVHIQKINRPAPWRVHWEDSWGQRHSKTFINELTARSYAEMLINHIEAEKNRASLLVSEMTIETAMEIFISNFPVAREDSRTTYLRATTHFRAAFQGQTVAQVSPLDLMKYFNARQKELSPSYYYYEMNRVKKFFQFALRQNLIVRDPAEELRAPRARSRKGFHLEYEDEKKIIEATTPTMLPRLIICLDTGMRVRDMYRLTRSALDFDRRVISFRVKKAKDMMLILPMTRRLVRAVEPYQAGDPRGMLFPISYSTTSSGSTRMMETAVHLTGIQCTPHIMRHTFSARLYEASRDDAMRHFCLGHLMDQYLHPTTEMLRDAFDKMEAARDAAFSKLETEVSPSEMWRELEAQ